MTRRLVALLAATTLLALVTAAKPPAETTIPLRLVLDLSDGSRVVGAPAVQTLRMVTSYGKFDLPFSQIRNAEFHADKETATVELRNGDRLSGVPDAEAFDLDTAFGKARIGLGLVRRLHVRPGGRGGAEGLTLWSTLDSRDQIESCRVGPGGTCKGGTFEAGKFGEAFAVRYDEINKVSFPREVVNAEAGCIEFWARLVGFPSALAWGQNPRLFDIGDDQRSALILHLNGNDGCGLGGVCASMSGMGQAGTGPYGSWTYERALGTPKTDEWHHYAVVWNAKGIPNVDNGARKLAVFVDGTLNSRSWNDDPGSPEPFAYGEIRLMFQQHLRGGRIQYDNLKVWNCAKTDFSDRMEE